MVKPFVKPTKDMVIVGGPKAPNLFVTVKDRESIDEEYDIVQFVIDEISDVMGIHFWPKKRQTEVVQRAISGWENADAKAIVMSILQGTPLDLTLTGVEKSGGELLDAVHTKKSEEERSDENDDTVK